ncbi:MAG TPA: hypothetical protein VK524_14470 [Polyangiaceae bacterium]|nr:hypothetical protein [Polyangiaceae bacterium]
MVVSGGNVGLITLRLLTPAGEEWTVDFAVRAGSAMRPGLYDPAQGYPFNSAGYPALAIRGNGRGCTGSGRFSIEELDTDPTSGVTRVSATFEFRCENATPGIRGVINYNATGAPDPSHVSSRNIALTGPVTRAAYDPVEHMVYGVDSLNRRLAKISLSTGAVVYSPVVQTPADICVDRTRGSVFVVNKGSSLISQHSLSDLSLRRQITWAGTDPYPAETRLKIFCGAGRVYIADGAGVPGLFSLEGLDSSDGAAPRAVDRTAQVAGVGGLTLTNAGNEFYYWHQNGWNAGNLNTAVKRVSSATFSVLDETAVTASENFQRDPLDTPVLLDERRRLVFVKNKVFDTAELKRVIYTLPGRSQIPYGAVENAYALDGACGLLASRSYIYELGRYDIFSPTLSHSADQMFFDREGSLWFVLGAERALRAQSTRY